VGERWWCSLCLIEPKEILKVSEDPSELINRLIAERRAFTEAELDALEAAVDRLRNPVRVGRCPPSAPAPADMLLIVGAIERSFLCNSWEAKFIRSIRRQAKSGRFRPSEKQLSCLLTLVHQHVLDHHRRG
jgi:hypothetical protein